jgi:anaerobic magnesium-protoporphyrin IX monomethyl ester cyclase
MNKHPVVLIAFKESDNLGIGYLASVLSEKGINTAVIDFRYSKEKILKILLKLNPSIVGFSVIFQFYIEAFAELINYIRKGGINCHFTAGGHYASLRYCELFELIPSLDSIVRFEGEKTLPDLVKSIISGKDWTQLKGIAYRKYGKVLTNPLRPLEKDLDRFPFPMRSPLKEYVPGKKVASIIAGRGCIYDCSYCNAREYFRQPSGPAKRVRKPEMVVKEIELLYYDNDCSIFLFEDDDFPVMTKNGNEWIERFCDELHRKKLDKNIMWKINCRTDEVDLSIFSMMKKFGLFLVFVGIEDGTDAGLARLNKHMTAERSLEGIKILKRLKIGFDFGFMLFQPSSTFISIRENINFLNKICIDGYTPVTFLKMLPFFETRVEKELIKEGRLTGTPGFYDYRLLGEPLNKYYDFFEVCFAEWLRDPNGLLNLARWARNYISVFSYFYNKTYKIKEMVTFTRQIIAESNKFVLETMKFLANRFEAGEVDEQNLIVELKSFRNYVSQKHEYYKEQIKNCLSQLMCTFQAVEQLQHYNL